MNNMLCASLSFRIQIFHTPLHVYLKGFGDVRIAILYLERAYARIAATANRAGPAGFYQVFHFAAGNLLIQAKQSRCAPSHCSGGESLRDRGGDKHAAVPRGPVPVPGGGWESPGS